MQIFITGGTGLIGTSLIPALVREGHTVTALSRNDSSDTTLTALGARPIRGTLADLSILATAATAATAIIHAAFDHTTAFQGPAGHQSACTTDRAAIGAMGDALAAAAAAEATTGTPERTFVYTSGTLGIASGADERSDAVVNEAAPRYRSEEMVRSLAGRGVRAVIVRLPPVVHAAGWQHPFIMGLVVAGRARGSLPLVVAGPEAGPGPVWASTQVGDVARLCVLVLQKGVSGNYHAVGEAGVATREIVGLLARRLGVPVREVTAEEAMTELGFLGMVLAKGTSVVSERTRQQLGWKPEGCGLLEELEGYSI